MFQNYEISILSLNVTCRIRIMEKIEIILNYVQLRGKRNSLMQLKRRGQKEKMKAFNSN